MREICHIDFTLTCRTGRISRVLPPRVRTRPVCDHQETVPSLFLLQESMLRRCPDRRPTNQANGSRADGPPAPPASGPVEPVVGRHSLAVLSPGTSKYRLHRSDGYAQTLARQAQSFERSRQSCCPAEAAKVPNASRNHNCDSVASGGSYRPKCTRRCSRDDPPRGLFPRCSTPIERHSGDRWSNCSR